MLKVNTLGKFQITYEGKTLDNEEIRSVMMDKLLVYLMLYRNQTLTVNELMDALWQEEEIDNPAGALKNLMYRLRNLLKKHFGDVNFILTGRGTYSWNPEVELEMDAECFEKLAEQAKNSEADEKVAIHLYETAMALYQGEFMAGIQEMHWAVTRSVYYHSVFLQCLKRLAELYIHNEMYEELENICNTAINYDKTEEQIYYYLMLARMKSNKMQLAMETYESAKRILQAQFGAGVSPKLQGLYEELLKQGNKSEATDISKVQEDIAEKNPQGAFYCGYPVFREIYRLEARKMRRMTNGAYILLLTVESVMKESEKVASFRVKNAMIHLEEIVMETLRLGDVVSRYSDNQFIIMLQNCGYEAGEIVAKRIIQQFSAAYSNYKNIKIQVDLEKLKDAEPIVIQTQNNGDAIDKVR